MPKVKRRGKGGKGEKEKPLLTVQGVLRLEKSFVPPLHEDAQTILVKKSEEVNFIGFILRTLPLFHEKSTFFIGGMFQRLQLATHFLKM